MGRIPSRAQGPRRLASERGFTLIEVAVVLSILGILVGLGAYALFSYWRAETLSGAADQLLRDFRDAQVRSRSEVTSFRLIFDEANDSYEIWAFKESASCTPGPCWIRLEERRFDDASIDLRDATWPSDTVEFVPRGVATTTTGAFADGTVTLQSRKLDQDRLIRVTGLTARIEVS